MTHNNIAEEWKCKQNKKLKTNTHTRMQSMRGLIFEVYWIFVVIKSYFHSIAYQHIEFIRFIIQSNCSACNFSNLLNRLAISVVDEMLLLLFAVEHFDTESVKHHFKIDDWNINPDLSIERWWHTVIKKLFNHIHRWEFMTQVETFDLIHYFSIRLLEMVSNRWVEGLASSAFAMPNAIIFHKS